MTTVLITGGHSGIGLAATRALAAQHVDLVLAGRSPHRIRPVADELRAAYGVSVSTLPLDVSSLASVRAAAAQFRAMPGAGALDALLCNAGGRFDGPVSHTEDGYETTFATNCLGHFLHVELLLPGLAERGRVVFTASGTHDPDTADGRFSGRAVEPDAVALAGVGTAGGAPLSAGKRYSSSKLCTVMYAYELDRRLRRAGSSVTSTAFDPGYIPSTGLLRRMPTPVRWLAATPAMTWVTRRLGVTVSTAEFSGAALAALAVDPAYASRTGEYFQADDGTFAAVRSARLSYDERRAAALWEDSRRLAHLAADEEPGPPR